jgi:preprotein translocase subunit SecG
MYILVLIVHVIVSLLLIGVILVQGGRGGMTETLGGAAAQSLFGGGANIVMSRVTAVGAMLFMVTCVTLAMLSTQTGRSVIDRIPVSLPAVTDAVPSLPGMPYSDTAPVPTEPSPAQ